MNEVDSFKERAIAHGVCSEYKTEWDDCKSKKQLMDLGLNVGCTDYLCKAIAEGWGVTVEDIANKYWAYINDNYIAQENGYTSKMYAAFHGAMIANTTQVVVVGCTGTLVVPMNAICEVKVVDSNITITGEGSCNVKSYGSSTIDYKAGVKHHEL